MEYLSEPYRNDRAFAYDLTDSENDTDLPLDFDYTKRIYNINESEYEDDTRSTSNELGP